MRFRYLESFAPAVAVGVGIAVALLTRSRPVITAALMAAVLAWPLATSIDVARTGRYDSQTLGALPTGYVQSLEPYTRSGRLAVSSAVLAGPLIVHDAAPLTVLTSWSGRPFTTLSELIAKVARGDVRYALLDPRYTAPAIQWALRHGRTSLTPSATNRVCGSFGCRRPDRAVRSRADVERRSSGIKSVRCGPGRSSRAWST